MRLENTGINETTCARTALHCDIEGANSKHAAVIRIFRTDVPLTRT